MISISNLTNNSTAGADASRESLNTKYDIVKINKVFIPCKSEGKVLPSVHLTEISSILLTDTASSETIDLTNSVKEIEVNYGN